MGGHPDRVLVPGSGGAGGLWGVQVPPAQRNAPGDPRHHGTVSHAALCKLFFIACKSPYSP